MEKVCVFLADGFEEGEALIPVDLLRRAGAEVTTASISTSLCVQGSHGITVTADALAENVPLEEYGMVVLPGGLRGTQNLSQSALVKRAVLAFARQGKWVAAICAAPGLLGEWGLLQGRRATCYPSAEEKCAGAVLTRGEVCTDGNLVTGRGLGAAIPFALALVGHIAGQRPHPRGHCVHALSASLPQRKSAAPSGAALFVLYFSSVFPACMASFSFTI